MSAETRYPTTLLEAIRYFADPDKCLDFLVQIRWPEAVTCPRCQSEKVKFMASQRKWQCNGCRKQFSIKVGTIFEDSPLGLDKWLCALWLLVNAKNGISSYELARALGVTQKTAWFMEHRLRLALQHGTIETMSGTVEADETFVGGKAQNMHPGKRKAKGRGAVGKAVVMGLLERHGEDATSRVTTKVIPDTKRNTVQAEVRAHVEPGAEFFTDALASYQGLDEYFHAVVDHAETYVDGAVHTDGLENFWSLLKRSIKGTYVSVEPFHLFRYLDEQSFRFNERRDTDLGRFVKAAMGLTGKRLDYKTLIGEGLSG
jgi:transposase-like protein